MKIQTNFPQMTSPVLPAEVNIQTATAAHNVAWSRNPETRIEAMSPEDVRQMVRDGSIENIADILMDLAGNLVESRQEAYRMKRYRDMYFDIQTRMRRNGEAS